jgi:hypothetical protein
VLGRATPSEDSGPLREIARLAPPVREAEALLARLERLEQEARSRLELLIRRFERFRAEGFHRWSPVHADRVEGLIRGIPDHPRRWQAVLEQLDRAESLLDRLELHGRRLLAAELDRSVEALEERFHRHDDPEAESLLRELAASDGPRVPPLSLRRRVREHLANPTRFAERRNSD